MVMRFIITGTILLFTSILVSGQGGSAYDPLGRLRVREMSGNITMTIDSLIVENYNKHLIQNRKNIGVEGYRIRIFSDNGHGALESQKRVKANFLSLYPEIPTYNKYEGSYYKIYIGDFRTKRDALKTLDAIRRNFPDAFIVEDKIVIEE